MNQLLKNKVFQNASWIIACRVAQMLINLVVGMLTARYLGPDNYGVINYAGSVVAFTAPIMQLGFSNILVQEIVNKPEEEGRILGTTIALSLISSAFCILGVLAFTSIANASEPETIVAAVAQKTKLKTKLDQSSSAKFVKSCKSGFPINPKK